MKLTDLAKNITEAMEICKKEGVNPEIWVQTNRETTQIDKISLVTGKTENNKKVGFITIYLEKNKE